jgi:DNA-directed RNA polymerase subunit F
MIISKKPVTMAEAASLAGESKDEEKKPVHGYFKKFTNLSKKDADKLVDEIRAINNPKLKEENLMKIADFLPRDNEDLSKILNEVGLSEAESNSILEIVKKY